MKLPALAAASLVLSAAMAPTSASAESLRCQAGIASEGDSKISLLYKCGPPTLADSFCAPVHRVGSVPWAPKPHVDVVVPCQPTEELVYDRGQGNLVATVRVRDGVVRSISYGRVPR